VVQSQPWQIFRETLSQKKKKITKIGLVEWLKLEALGSNPSVEKKQKQKP
jgi:hypothetical protein